ncbi:MAG: efflux RND transporter periplasmic adaptor subunit [Sulfitobacter sp.]
MPESRPLLERTGLFDLLGIEMPHATTDGASAGRPRGGATDVVTELAVERAMADRITSIGDGRALRSVTVRSNAVGVITDLTLASGRRIEAGEVIARLQDEAEKIALEQAQIRLDEARNEEQRIKRLQTSGAVTEVRLRETETALRTAELALREAEFNLSQRQVSAPISGWVGIIGIEQGDRVNSQDVIATITDRSAILIDFRVPERVVGKIAKGQRIEVTPLALRDVILEGEIDTIDTVVDRASRTLLVRGQVRNSEDLLRAGMAFSVSLSFPGVTLLSIAPLAVQWSSEGPFVWVVRDGKAVQVAVTIEQRNSDSVLIISDDLKAGDAVVTEGVQTLRDGAEVTPVGPQDSAFAPTGPVEGDTL